MSFPLAPGYALDLVHAVQLERLIRHGGVHIGFRDIQLALVA